MELFHSVKLLFLLLVSGALADSQKYAPVNRITRTIKNAVLDIETRNNIITLTITSNSTFMKNVLQTKTPGSFNEPLVLDANCGNNNICVKSGNATHAIIQANGTAEIVSVSRTVLNPTAEIIDCFELGDYTQWFGGPQLRYQHWPIQHMYYEQEPYVPTHQQNMALSERYWLSGDGVYIYVDKKSPLFLDQNNYKAGHLCLVAKNKAPYRHRNEISLNYEIGVFKNPRQAHENVVKNHFGKPKDLPNKRMVQHPIWSTWARYKANINESIVESFANEILQYKFNNSQIEIDDNWETCYGSAVFDPKKFPNITSLVRRLKAKGFRVTLWIHPFINVGCEPAYSTALKNSYFVKNLAGNVHTSWWQGQHAAAIDFTNPKAVQWWIFRLKLLQQIGIVSFKFDAGEVSFLPQVPSLTGPLDVQPGIFTYNYVKTVADHFDDSIEARVGWHSQQLPIFIRMIDKDTKWTWNNGLPTLITTLLQMNLNGYVYVLPDMIGGNGYLDGSLNATEYPPKELFIRWLQANVFMPVLQYSFVPWDFDNQTVAISRKFTNMHAQITPTIMKLMAKSVATGAPLNPPIWWIDPTNMQAHKINDEYLLGEDILVAPVIEEGATSRDVYLPSGRWRDANTNRIYVGPTWLLDYPAPLDVLPYFLRMSSA